MLKGWCGRHHTIAKVLHLDFIHTQSGLPCFLQHYDNFYDLRERFFISLSQFEKLFPKKSLSGSTFILDRGIFGQDIFSKFRKHDCHLITWEKGYKEDGWNAKTTAVKFQRYRQRNQPGDLKEYSFECQESPWPKNDQIRRILARATNPKGNTIEVSILCTNPKIELQEIVSLIFNRWIQENSFRYLDLYFGLMQITSYASENYQDIAHSLIDRYVDAPEYRKLKHRFSTKEQALGKLLLKFRRTNKLLESTQQQCSIICQSVSGIENQIEDLSPKSGELKHLEAQLKELRKIRSNLKRKTTNLKKRLLVLEKSIKEKEEILTKLDSELEDTLRKKSRVDGLIEGAFQRPEVRRKAMMDALRIMAHNMFQNMMSIFRPIYGNYRNDHVMLRMLTRTDGFMWMSNSVIQIRLWLKGRYAHHQKNKFERFIQSMADFINGHFAGRANLIEIKTLDTESQMLELTKNHGVQLVTPSS